MTTNRLEILDPAIQSRINMIIKYPDLIDKNRIIIWKQSLINWKELNSNDVMLLKLSEHDLNGREILKICQTAMSVITFKKQDVTCSNFTKIVTKCILINQEFKETNARIKSTLYL